LSWRGIERHFLALTILCAIAGTAATALPIGVVTLLPRFAVTLAHPLARELVQVSLAITVVVPALVLLLRSYEGQEVMVRDVAVTSMRRVVVIVSCQAAIDMIIVAPAYLLGLPVVVLTTIYLIYEIPLLAFNYVLFAALAAEQPIEGSAANVPAIVWLLGANVGDHACSLGRELHYHRDVAVWRTCPGPIWMGPGADWDCLVWLAAALGGSDRCHSLSSPESGKGRPAA
jgi:hypothetical protein